MTTNDLYKNENEYRNSLDSYGNSTQYRKVAYKYDKNFRFHFFIDKIKKSRKLKIQLGVISIFLIALVTSVVIMLYPLLIQFTEYVGRIGIGGLIDTFILVLAEFTNVLK